VPPPTAVVFVVDDDDRENEGDIVIAGIPTHVAYEESAHWLRTRVVAAEPGELPS
jgi:3,4-dihydroxy-2-butanone 4-phosphate synthase